MPGDSTTYGPTARTRLRRLSQRGSYDRGLVHALLDEALVCHVGFVHEAQPYVLPMAFARIGELLYVHGAVANRMLGSLAGGASICVTVTLLDGLVLARSAFHHSMNYRSLVALGPAREVLDPPEKLRAFDALVDRCAPERSREARGANAEELRATRVFALELLEVSAKMRSGPPLDDEDDLAHPCWAGVIPLSLERGDPVPDTPHALPRR
jgi:nitroimidazol reductase NimA-like FMN-containing flavoprotein (pyridoxamine 5'-phosphate oxidase superfamily)